ncbi:hypothetical protein KO495_04125 [Colwellia sp. D2M02]|uniref:hypothetical protein n=1 Tax=Colwellia sp. D2M02 TaxID=2841562 RepID=UPI001C07F8F0|nr:hypothetical protein [Colwellia sp. D2M02]MBU2892509.1 hypothetical protein [Colwellia sp. D2M02]
MVLSNKVPQLSLFKHFLIYLGSSPLVRKLKDNNLTFFVVFVLCSVLIQLTVWQIHQTPWLADSIQTALAYAAANLSQLFSRDVLLNENEIIHSLSQRYIVVDSQCTALSLIGTLLAAIIALPIKSISASASSVTFSQIVRIKGLIFFISAGFIQVLNIIRISHLFFEIKHPINNFEFYHLYVWQGINFVTVICIFYLIHQYVKRKLTLE